MCLEHFSVFNLAFQKDWVPLKTFQHLCFLLWINLWTLQMIKLRWRLNYTLMLTLVSWWFPVLGEVSFGTRTLPNHFRNWAKELRLYLKSSHHSSMVSTAACYWGGPGFKSWQGREFINFWIKRKFNNFNLNTIIVWLYELTVLV